MSLGEWLSSGWLVELRSSAQEIRALPGIDDSDR